MVFDYAGVFFKMVGTLVENLVVVALCIHRQEARQDAVAARLPDLTLVDTRAI
jgi:hypothetical protein